MSYCLRSLLLAALPLCVAAMSREAAAHDRFDVKIELIDFYSNMNADLPADRPNVSYTYTVHSDIAGIGRRSVVKAKLVGLPKTRLKMGRTLRYYNIEKPDRSDRLIRFTAKASSYYRKASGDHKIHLMGTGESVTSRDLFREADRSRDDEAVETIVIRKKYYTMVIRVTVIEID